MALIKTLKSNGPKNRPLGDTTCICLHWGTELLTTTLQPIIYLLNSSAFQYISLQFRDKDVVLDRVTGLAQVQAAATLG